MGDQFLGDFTHFGPQNATIIRANSTLLGQGTIEYPLQLSNTGVTPGTYSYSSVVVDQYGRIGSASSGATPLTLLTTDATLSGNGTSSSPLHAVTPASGTVGIAETARFTGNGLTASPLDMANSGVTPGTYVNPTTVTVDTFGRVTYATSGVTVNQTDLAIYATQPTANGITTTVDQRLWTNNQLSNGVISNAWSIAGGGNSYLAPVTGMYAITFSVTWNAVSSTGSRYAYVQISDGTVSNFKLLTNNVPGSTVNNPTNVCSGAYYLVAGVGTLTFTMLQNSGSSVTPAFTISVIYLGD